MARSPRSRPGDEVSVPLIPLESVRTKLAVLWLVGSLLILLLLVLQSLLNRYGDKTQEAWAWLLPSLMPTLSMIIAVLGYTALSPTLTGSVVRKDFFAISFWFSAFYLLVVAITILVQPLAATTYDQAIGLMRMSNLWLGPLQGLVSSLLGVLFVSKQRPRSKSG